MDTRVCVWWTTLANVKKYPKTRRVLKIFKWQQTLRSWKKSWNLKSSKEYKPCLFSLFTLSLTIGMQIGECPEALGSLFCSVTMHVIPYFNIWTPDLDGGRLCFQETTHDSVCHILFSHSPSMHHKLGLHRQPYVQTLLLFSVVSHSARTHSG